MSLKTKQISVLFVCTGNICRSPTAEGVFRHMVENAGLGKRIHVDSAGTIGFHIGESPDPRSQKVAKNRGIDLGNLRARQLHEDDFEIFDFLTPSIFSTSSSV